MLPFMLMVLASATLGLQDVDLRGTWVGDAVVPGSQKPSRIQLILEKNEESYSGKLSGLPGVQEDVPLRDVSFKDANLRFTITIKISGRETRVYAGLNFFLGKLIGGWGIDTGDFRSLDLEREKM